MAHRPWPMSLFDKLAGIRPDERSREDRLPIALLDTIDGWLDNSGADALAAWSHTYLAHAGSPQSRERVADAIVTNNKIADAIKIIARVTEAISAYVLFASGRLNSLMPTAQFDQFENLDKPVMKPGRIGDAYKLWDSPARFSSLRGAKRRSNPVTAITIHWIASLRSQ
jgi:hypothetical protein